MDGSVSSLRLSRPHRVRSGQLRVASAQEKTQTLSAQGGHTCAAAATPVVAQARGAQGGTPTQLNCPRAPPPPVSRLRLQ